jgi:hypothetical protein
MSVYHYVSTEDAIRVAHQGARDTLRRFNRLRDAVSGDDPGLWYPEAAHWLVDSWTLLQSPWPASLDTTQIAGRLPPAARTVQSLIDAVSLACINTLPGVDGLAHALRRALQDVSTENSHLFYLEDLPRLLAVCPIERWQCSRAGRVTAPMQRLRRDPCFLVARAGMLRALRRWMYRSGMRVDVSSARQARELIPPYSEEANIDLDVLQAELDRWDVAELRAVVSSARQEPQAQRPRMSSEEANRKAMQLAEADHDFVTRTAQEWAQAIGCSAALVVKLPFWREVMEQTGRERRGKKPRAVGLTEKVLATAPDDQAELDRLIAEQQADHEPSPLDGQRSRTRCRKQL